MPRVKLFNEEEVLTKAMELFWKKGYHATSMQDLVDNLGINRASLYDTYGGKKSLYDQALQQYRNGGITWATQFFQNQPSVKTGIRVLLEKAVNDAVCDPDNKGCFMVNSVTELISDDKELKAIMENEQAAYENLFYNFLLSGEEKGEFAKGKDLKAIAGLIFILYNGIKVVTKIKSDEKSLLASVDAILKLLD